MTDKNIKEKVKKIVAYIDGSYSPEKQLFSFGAIIISDEKEECFAKAFNDEDKIGMRNVAGEIMGSMFVIEYCINNNIHEVDLHYDYDGIEKWCTGEWKARKPGTIEYKFFYDNNSDKVKINFVKVKAHSGDKYNEIADNLAKKALETQNTTSKKEPESQIDDRCYKELNLDRRKILSVVIDFFIVKGIILSEELTERLINPYTKRITYDSQNRGMIQYTYNDNGTTTLICKIGKMQNLNIEIADYICEKCIIDSSNSKSFSVRNVEEDDYCSIIELIDESDICKVVEKKVNNDPNAKEIYKITGNNDNSISLIYYKNGTLRIQGKPLLMFYECMSIISELVDFDESNKAYNDYFDVEVPRESIEEKYEIYMFNSYDKMPNHLRNIVKQSIYNTCIESTGMYDYTYLVFPAFRAMEGFIKYVLREEYGILINRNEQSESFPGMFSEISKGCFVLKHEPAIKSKIKDHICKMYGHYHVNRHTLFHMEDLLEDQVVESRVISSMVEARQLIVDTLKLIDVYYTITET